MNITSTSILLVLLAGTMVAQTANQPSGSAAGGPAVTYCGGGTTTNCVQKLDGSGNLSIGTTFPITNVTLQLATPAAPSVTALCSGSPCGGSTTYKYAIIAVSLSGGVMGAATTITDGNATLDATHINRIVIPSISGASGCMVYRFVDGGGSPNNYGNGPLSQSGAPFDVETFSCGTTLDDAGRFGWFFTSADWVQGPSNSTGISSANFSSTGAGFGSEQFGYLASAFGSEATAFGWASNSDSIGVAVGANAISAQGGTTVGYNAFASNGVALGPTAVANTGIAIGSNASSANAGTAVGSNASATDTSIAVGNNSSGTGTQSLAIGANASAGGVNSTAIGNHASTSSDNHLVFGNTALTDVYFGSETPSAVIHAAGGSVTKLACWKVDGVTLGWATMVAGDISACN